jgi:hypothetical protein
MNIIAISGKKGSGKDTVGDIILSDYKGISAKVGFAFALKLEVAKAFNITVDELESKKSHFRLVLQGWGTDVRRHLYGDDYWLRKMDAVIKSLVEEGCQLLIIPDVRFKNELEYCEAHGAITIRVERPSLPYDSHKSETELDNNHFDYILRNDKTLFELECLVKQIKVI